MLAEAQKCEMMKPWYDQQRCLGIQLWPSTSSADIRSLAEKDSQEYFFILPENKTLKALQTKGIILIGKPQVRDLAFVWLYKDYTIDKGSSHLY